MAAFSIGITTKPKASGEESLLTLVSQRPRNWWVLRKSYLIVGWDSIMPGAQKDTENSDEVLLPLKLF